MRRGGCHTESFHVSSDDFRTGEAMAGIVPELTAVALILCTVTLAGGSYLFVTVPAVICAGLAILVLLANWLLLSPSSKVVAGLLLLVNLCTVADAGSRMLLELSR